MQIRIDPRFDGAWLHDHTPTSSFDAYQNRGPGTTTRFRADETEFTQSLTIFREVWVKGTPDVFSYNSSLTQATVAPPAPFQGQASFAATDDRGHGTLSGTLTAVFPGNPTPVSLVGSEGKARIRYAKVTFTP